jgi:hypothetical protein
MVDWSDVTEQLRSTNPRLLQAFQATYIDGRMLIFLPPPPFDTASSREVRGFGGRPGTLNGVPTATFDLPISEAGRTRLILVLHDRRRYMIQLTCHPRDFDRCASDAQEMLSSWRWRY